MITLWCLLTSFLLRASCQSATPFPLTSYNRSNSNAGNSAAKLLPPSPGNSGEAVNLTNGTTEAQVQVSMKTSASTGQLKEFKRRNNVIASHSHDPISAFLARLVIIDPSPYLPEDYNLSMGKEGNTANVLSSQQGGRKDNRTYAATTATDRERNSSTGINPHLEEPSHGISSKEEEESVHGSSMKSTVIVDNSMMHATNGTSETGETTLKRSNDSDPDVLKNNTTKKIKDELGELREEEVIEEISSPDKGASTDEGLKKGQGTVTSEGNMGNSKEDMRMENLKTIVVHSWAWLASFWPGLASFVIIAVAGSLFVLHRCRGSRGLNRSSVYSVNRNRRLDLTTRSRDPLFQGDLEDSSRFVGRPSDFWTMPRPPGHWEEGSQVLGEDKIQAGRAREESFLVEKYFLALRANSCSDEGGSERWQNGLRETTEVNGKHIKEQSTPVIDSRPNTVKPLNSEDDGLKLKRTKTMRLGLSCDFPWRRAASDEETLGIRNQTFNLEDEEESCSDGSSFDI